MNERLLRGSYEHVRLHHVPMTFSRELDDVGRARPGKLLSLGALLLRTRQAIARHHPQVLYYSPAGQSTVAVLRDLAFLPAIRGAIPHTLFHFHASGLAGWLEHAPRPLAALARAAYAKPDVAIELYPQETSDAAAIEARQLRIVPNGIEDVYPQYRGQTAWRELTPVPARTPSILFVGALRESKGVLVLIDAIARLAARGVRARARLLGPFVSRSFEKQVRARIAELDLDEAVKLAGVRTGAAKWREYAQSDIFCLPTFYENEALPLVVLEAMQFELPVVATAWRGIPTQVCDGETGYLVPTQDPDALADRLQRLIADPTLRQRMGRAGRARFCQEHSESVWRSRMQDALLAAAGR